MTLYVILVILDCLTCVAIFVTSWGRILKMDEHTRPGIRLGTVLLGVAALANSLAPFIGQWHVLLSWPQLVMNGSILFVQVTTGRLWRKGVPKAFQLSPSEVHHQR